MHAAIVILKLKSIWLEEINYPNYLLNTIWLFPVVSYETPGIQICFDHCILNWPFADY